jgi:hypothetical protein
MSVWSSATNTVAGVNEVVASMTGLSCDTARALRNIKSEVSANVIWL